ncbi:hypothetical protein M378DRAFT_334500 [Amanita muscaria Koide BX008]|uniref:Uncharacterized protein n=1 Tax=Amanita muscaria (strain Koide BX008) TaxID=946122 RepID=A0A0C2WNJ2_AMAMK|nr:hypothetical protein M378DRAFT_334500 [Amanita muscaria Koide BX008]
MFAIEGIASNLRQEVDSGNIRRADATQSLVATLWNNNPHYNYVICYVPHDYSFQGKQGVD